MFYCNDCADKYEYPQTIFKSNGYCECCDTKKECNDMPSSKLPPPKKQINLKYVKVTAEVTSFQLGDEPEMIHVIKTGFKDKYMVVHEDSYEVVLGDVQIGTKAEIENMFDINLTNNNKDD